MSGEAHELTNQTAREVERLLVTIRERPVRPCACGCHWPRTPADVPAHAQRRTITQSCGEVFDRYSNATRARRGAARILADAAYGRLARRFVDAALAHCDRVLGMTRWPCSNRLGLRQCAACFFSPSCFHLALPRKANSRRLTTRPSRSRSAFSGSSRITGPLQV